MCAWIIDGGKGVLVSRSQSAILFRGGRAVTYVMAVWLCKTRGYRANRRRGGV